jgi:hypothetical protein
MDSYANPDNDATVAAAIIHWAKQEAAMEELTQEELVEIFSNDALFLARHKLYGLYPTEKLPANEWIYIERCSGGPSTITVDKRVNSVYIIQHATQAGAYLRIFYLDPVANEVYIKTCPTDCLYSNEEFKRVEFKEVDEFRWKMVRVSA